MSGFLRRLARRALGSAIRVRSVGALPFAEPPSVAEPSVYARTEGLSPGAVAEPDAPSPVGLPITRPPAEQSSVDAVQLASTPRADGLRTVTEPGPSGQPVPTRAIVDAVRPAPTPSGEGLRPAAETGSSRRPVATQPMAEAVRPAPMAHMEGLRAAAEMGSSRLPVPAQPTASTAPRLDAAGARLHGRGQEPSPELAPRDRTFVPLVPRPGVSPAPTRPSSRQGPAPVGDVAAPMTVAGARRLAPRVHAGAEADSAEVHVHIGRIEVTAVSAPPLPKRTARAQPRPMSLAEYQERRRGKGR